MSAHPAFNGRRRPPTGGGRLVAEPIIVLDACPSYRPGTVTFLFTDVEGWTRLLAEAGQRYGALLEEHRVLIRDAVERAGGSIIGTEEGR